MQYPRLTLITVAGAVGERNPPTTWRIFKTTALFVDTQLPMCKILHIGCRWPAAEGPEIACWRPLSWPPQRSQTSLLSGGWWARPFAHSPVPPPWARSGQKLKEIDESSGRKEIEESSGRPSPIRPSLTTRQASTTPSKWQNDTGAGPGPALLY